MARPRKKIDDNKNEIILPWVIEKTDTNAVRYRQNLLSTDKKKRILLLSDLHWDSAHCKRDYLKSVLDEAKADNAPVFIFGDMYDAMQGKWDPRSSQDTLRPEHRGPNYLDLLVDTSVEWFLPYKDILALVTYGNHETAIMKRHEVDLIQRFVGIMRKEGSRVLVGPYWGFILLAFANGAEGTLRPGADLIKRLAWHHGYGGGGEVTRGMIDHSRSRGMYDADIYVSGHIHRRNYDENIITRVSSKGIVHTMQQLFLRCSCWKEETTGYHVEKGRAARPVGGWWLNLQAVRSRSDGHYEVLVRPEQT